MKRTSSMQRSILAAATLALATCATVFAEDATSVPTRAMDRLSPAIQVANDRGVVDANLQINLTVHLAGDRAGLDRAIADLYDPASPRFHKWMTDEDLKKFAPTPQQLKVVQTELESHGLKTLSVSSNGFLLRVTGRVADVESAFQTRMHQFERADKVFRANVTPAHLSGEADRYVSSVAGLESHVVRPTAKRAINLKTGKAPNSISLAKVNASGGLSNYIADLGLTSPATFSLTTPGAKLPVGVFYGTQYGINSNLVTDFDPHQLQAVYGLPAAYQAGFSGKGETVILLEGYGDTHIASDLNAFSELTSLPVLTSSTYSTIYPYGRPSDPNAAAETGWDTEIAIDTQWAHAIAPQAKIVVVATNGQDSEDFQASISYITDHVTGYTVSSSWEEDQDNFAGPAEMQSFEDVLKLGAAKGISFQFSTGDGGDGGLGTPIGAPGVPSDAPHAVAVGGTSILNKLSGGGFEQAGWGDTETIIDSGGVYDPPLVEGLQGGSGGGESVYFVKPAWQKKLPGTGRQTPDISALADPYTGVPIVLTVEGEQQLQVGWGGTSLACPIFSAFWALAQQKAGGPLGQASPLIAALPAGAINDVLPTTSESVTNLTGTVVDANGATFYSASDLFSGSLFTATGFTGTVWDQSSPDYEFVVDFGFGLDGALTVAKGWDNVTGFGTPNGLPFLEAVAKAATAK